MESVFKVVFYIDPSHRAKLGGIDPKKLAESTASDAFEICDINQSGTLTFEEFYWYVTRFGGSRFAFSLCYYSIFFFYHETTISEPHCRDAQTYGSSCYVSGKYVGTILDRDR